MGMGKTIFCKLNTSENFSRHKGLHCMFKTEKKNADKLQIMRKKKGIKHTVNYKL